MVELAVEVFTGIEESGALHFLSIAHFPAIDCCAPAGPLTTSPIIRADKVSRSDFHQAV
jgi:hypothetical protein